MTSKDPWLPGTDPSDQRRSGLVTRPSEEGRVSPCLMDKVKRDGGRVGTVGTQTSVSSRPPC